MRERTDIELLKLSGADSHVRRALKRKAKDPEITRELESNIRQLNRLIKMLERECLKGPVLRGTKKRNPAFQFLASFLRLREQLTKHKKRREPKPAKPADASKGFGQFITDPPLLVPEHLNSDAGDAS